MSLDNSRWCFRFEGSLWVSELSHDEARQQLVEQRAWDATHLRTRHWGGAIGIGAVLGTTVILGIGIAAGSPPTNYLLGLPIGFAIGAVLGAVVNKRIIGPELTTATPRPTIVALTRVPAGVSRKAPEDASASAIIRWSSQRFVD